MKRIFLGLILSVITYFGIISISYSNQSLEIETFIFDECTYRSTIHKEDFQRCYEDKKKIANVNPSKFLADQKNKQNAIEADKKTRSDKSIPKGTYYCWNPENKNFYTRDITVHKNPLNRCEKEEQPKAVEISKDIYDKSQKMIGDPSFHLWMPEHQQKLVELVSNPKTENKSYKNEIINDKKNVNISVNKNIKADNSKFSKKCEGGLFSSGYKKGTDEFNDCVKREEKLVALDEQKKQIINEEKNKKIQQKKELDQAKIREEQIKVSNMKPEDRNAYTCSEKFGFRKGSDKFKDCIFELYKAETELEKLELQKQVATANAEAARASAEAARASADRQERLALAQTEAAKMQALAARQQAIAANTADSLALIESGLRMMSPQRPAPRMQTSCTYVGRFLNCF